LTRWIISGKSKKPKANSTRHKPKAATEQQEATNTGSKHPNPGTFFQEGKTMGRKKDEPLNLKIITPKQKEILKTRPKITLAQALYAKQKFEQYDPKKRIPEIADGFGIIYWKPVYLNFKMEISFFVAPNGEGHSQK
jgi:hypothetical protein